jgi:cytochrome b561
MTLRNTPDRYGSISIGLHWLTLVVLIGGALLVFGGKRT